MADNSSHDCSIPRPLTGTWPSSGLASGTHKASNGAQKAPNWLTSRWELPRTSEVVLPWSQRAWELDNLLGYFQRW